MKSLRELVIGPPLSSQQQGEERLTRLRALAALSPDALSSIAYANQEIFLGLVAAGAAGLAVAEIDARSGRYLAAGHDRR